MNDLRDTERRLSNLLHDTTPEPPASIDLHALARTAKTPSRRTNQRLVRRWTAPLVAAAAVLGAIAGGLAIVAGGGAAVPGSGSDEPPAAQVEQAYKAIAHWQDAVRTNPVLTVIPALQQVGQWEPGLAAKYAPVLAARNFRAPANLDRTPQAQSSVTWATGDVRPTGVLSAFGTFNVMTSSASRCHPCTPLVITGATRTTMNVQTTRGLATVPAWRFSLQGTQVQVLQSALPIPNVKRIPHDSQRRIHFIHLDRSVVQPDDQTITAEFVGARHPGSEVCGEDYTATAVETDDAVVIIVTTLPKPSGGSGREQACNTMGWPRTAEVRLRAELGGRPVIQLGDGVPARLVRK